MDQRLSNYHFYALNFRLQSRNAPTSTTYEKLFTTIVNSRRHVHVRGDRHVIVRTLFKSKAESTVFYEGQISKFTKIETNDWLNLESMEVENVVIPPNRFPNLLETDYVFVPALHRFAMLKRSGFSPSNALLFFEGAAKEVIENSSNFYVNLEQSTDGFERILRAKEILKLHIETTPTNDDIVDEATEFMDRELKEMMAGRIEMNIKPDAGNKHSMKSKVLNGSLGLARSNGEVEAVIISESEHKEKVRTDAYPREFTVKATDLDAAKQSIVALLFGAFRRGK